MLGFLNFLIEAKKNKEGKAITGDAAGKLFELLKGKFQNRGNFPEDHRVEGKKPKDIHDITANNLFGNDFNNHPIYKNLSQAAEIAAELNNLHNETYHGHDKKRGYNRVAWTSQPADHEKETKVVDDNSVADSIVTLGNGKQLSHSDKLTGVGKPINYKNPGSQTIVNLTGAKKAEEQKDHADLLNRYNLKSGEKGHAEFKRLRDSDNPEERKIAEKIVKSSQKVNQGFARSVHAGLQQKQNTGGDEALRNVITSFVAPKTHLKTTVTHTEIDDRTGEHRRTRVYDLHDHINQYLNHFENLHVDDTHPEGQSSVSIYGHFKHPTIKNHPDNGKKMRLLNLSVYAGGKPTSLAPRGAVNLPSENHPSISYQNELDTKPSTDKNPINKIPSTKTPKPAKTTPEPKQVSNDMFGHQVHADHEILQGHA